jgi:hypothetical protein
VRRKPRKRWLALTTLAVAGAVWWVVSTGKPRVSFLQFETEGEFMAAIYLVENTSDQTFYYWGPSAHRPAEPHTRQKSIWGWDVTMRRDHPGDLFDEYRVEPGERVEMRFVLPVDRRGLPPFQMGIRFYRRTVFHELPWNWRERLPSSLLKPSEVIVWTETVNP